MPHPQFDMRKAPPADAPVRRSNRRRTAVIVLGMIVLLVGTLVLAARPFIGYAREAERLADEGQNELLAAQQAAGSLNVPAALERLDAAEDAFTDAQGEIAKLRPFSFIPYAGDHVRAADEVLTSGLIAVSAVREVLTATGDILAVLQESEGIGQDVLSTLPDAGTVFREMGVEEKRDILEALHRNAPRFSDALRKIDAAVLTFSRIDALGVSSDFRSSLEPIRAKLESLRVLFAALSPLAEHLPALVGYPEERGYLVFFQNNTELRPTGGFLGVFGELHMKDGEIQSIGTADIYAIDGPSEKVERPAPPSPIAKYIGIDQWYLRDANWSPDFPTSAEIMERFYREEFAVAYPGRAVGRIDGIIAVTPSLASDILRITGPLTVDGKTFDADNLVDQLEFEVERGFVSEGIPVAERKDIVGDLLDAIIGRLMALPLADLFGIVAAVDRNLKEGDILLSMKDPGLQRVILENDWGGKLRAVQGDYFLVVDANLASLKSDPAVHRTIAYTIARGGDGGYVASLAITYDHRGSFDWKTTRYRTYTRAYVPAGAELIEVRGAMENDRIKDPARRPGTPDVGEELGRTVFGAFVSVEPGEQRTLEFRYRLSPDVAARVGQGTYELYAEKQPGTSGHRLTLDLDFGKNVTEAEPAEPAQEFGDTRYRIETDLRTDRRFSVTTSR